MKTRYFSPLFLLCLFTASHAEDTVGYGSTKAAGAYRNNVNAYRVAPLPATDKSYGDQIFANIDRMGSRASAETQNKHSGRSKGFVARNVNVIQTTPTLPTGTNTIISSSAPLEPHKRAETKPANNNKAIPSAQSRPGQNNSTPSTPEKQNPTEAQPTRKKEKNPSAPNIVSTGQTVQVSGNSVNVLSPNAQRIETPNGTVTMTPDGYYHIPSVVIQKNGTVIQQH